MNGITILIWITIAIIGIIAIILVKLHYKGDELEKEEGFLLKDNKTLNNAFSSGQDFISNSINKRSSTQRNQNTYSRLGKENSPRYDDYIVPEIEVVENTHENIEYENSNQVLVDYGNTVQKFQEPIKESQMDIMNANNDKNEKTELKDLFTIDELIKESKRKDSEREKESQKIKAEDDEELNEIKESIKRRKENPETEEVLIEKIEDDAPETEEATIEIVEDETAEIKEETINDLINETSSDEEDTKIESSVSQKDIEEAINTAAQESEKEEVESISESQNITDVLLDKTEEKDIETEQTILDVEEEINEEELSEPKKIDEERKISKFGPEIEETNAINEYENDLDYRNDLAKIKNTIRQSKLYQDVKEKITPEEEAIDPNDESFIRNVNEYEDEYAPIINERHLDYDATYEEYHIADDNAGLRQENTRKVFKKTKNSPKRGESKPKLEIKEKPSRDNIKIQLNNNEVVLKKGDEIIFNHHGETYSSQVYAINGDDISVRYRRKNIKIKPSDVKKIY